MKNGSKKAPAGIEYAGSAGITEECKQGIMRLVQYGDRIKLARILSAPADQYGSRSHCLLLTVDEGELVAVKSGFSSGYGGEGPHGFSFALNLLQAVGAEIEEYEVDEDVCERLDMSALTNGDLERIDSARPVRPSRWHDYLFESNREKRRGGMWSEFPPVVPFKIVDGRIMDLALSFFESPDEKLLTGYRRLEDVVRKRTAIDEHGVKLFAEAFHGEKAKLGWKGCADNERTGRANLFTGGYMAYRNPRAHRELEHNASSYLTEFLLLNHLFLLESESIERIPVVTPQQAAQDKAPKSSQKTSN